MSETTKTKKLNLPKPVEILDEDVEYLSSDEYDYPEVQ